LRLREGQLHRRSHGGHLLRDKQKNEQNGKTSNRSVAQVCAAIQSTRLPAMVIWRNCPHYTGAA
jgi:hypothetical protein